MSSSRIGWLVLAAHLASLAAGQESGWQENQVNATMCSWKNPRTAILRDTAYIDGGALYWVPGMADGSFGPPTEDGNPLGYIYTLNFSRPFNVSTSNISDVLGRISKTNGGAANNLAPNYYDGAMLANDHELFLYGGLLRQTDAYSPPDSQEILGYHASQYGEARAGFASGFFKVDLPDDVTRYIAFGGAANAPSENKAWYFAGMRSPTWGPIFLPGANNSLNPVNTSDTLITLDMTTQLEETWSNVTLPAAIDGRASPDLLWVPVGPQGILVSLGGVSYPDFTTGVPGSLNEVQSLRDSPKFMSMIDIYDIANDKWYQQPTVAGPAMLTQGCAVVQPALDYSSYNIYYYGGYNGLDQSSDFDDDVWILSLPSFMWMKVASGNAKHARAGHRCVMPYPDQMLVIGGFTSQKEGNPSCVGESTIIEVFNLTSGDWLEYYEPTEWTNYGVPEMIHLMIGGDYGGGATMLVPTPTGWADPSLASVFATPYPTTKLTSYYPYPRDNSYVNRPDVGSGAGLQPWAAAVLGAVLGLVFLVVAVIAIVLYRRRRLLRKNGPGDGATDENGSRVISWMRGQDSTKAPTVTTEDTPIGSDDMERAGGPLPPKQSEMRTVQYHEMPDTPKFELMDTSPRAELSDTGMSAVDGPYGSRPQFGRSPNSASTPTGFSSPYDRAGSVSSPSPRGRPDSPALGTIGLAASAQARPSTSSRPTPPDSPAMGAGGVGGSGAGPSALASPPTADGREGLGGFDYLGLGQAPRSLTSPTGGNASLRSASSHRQSHFFENDGHPI